MVATDCTVSTVMHIVLQRVRWTAIDDPDLHWLTQSLANAIHCPANEPQRYTTHIIDETQSEPREPLGLRRWFCVTPWGHRRQSALLPPRAVQRSPRLTNANTSVSITHDADQYTTTVSHS